MAGCAVAESAPGLRAGIGCGIRFESSPGIVHRVSVVADASRPSMQHLSCPMQIHVSERYPCPELGRKTIRESGSRDAETHADGQTEPRRGPVAVDAHGCSLQECVRPAIASTDSDVVAVHFTDPPTGNWPAGNGTGDYMLADLAASAEPRAPAMSRSGTSAKTVTARCSSRRIVFARTVSRNQSRNSGAASTTPPPTK